MRGDIIIPAGANWEYSFNGGSSWNFGNAPFGNNVGGDFGYNTYWPADGADGVDLIVRKTIDLSGFDLNTIKWDLGVDNGFALYANSFLVASANAEGFTSRWEYSGLISSSFLNAGLNVITVNLEDHGGLTAFDMQLSGARAVPDQGSSLALLGSTLIAVFAMRRTRSAARR